MFLRTAFLATAALALTPPLMADDHETGDEVVLTAWAIGKTDRFRAAAVQKPVINMVSHSLLADGPTYFGPYWLGAFPWEEPQAFWDRSPLSLVDNVKTSTLVVVGSVDYRPPQPIGGQGERDHRVVRQVSHRQTHGITQSYSFSGA